MTTEITYGRSQEGWDGFRTLVAETVKRNRLRSVCDVGGGANPALDRDFIGAERINFSVIDISAEELDKTSLECEKIVADIAAPGLDLRRTFDLVYSKMLMEHIPNAEQLHKNIFALLNHGGYAIHFFPTLYAFPFVVNKFTPEFLSDKIFKLISSRDRYQHARFPAYYDWCRGPTKRQIGRFTNLGYDVVKYAGFFGHAGYYKKMWFFRDVHQHIAKFLLGHPSPHFTSYACVVLRKS